MAVAEIKLVSVSGLCKSFDRVVDILGKSGVFQPDDVAEFYSNTKNFEHFPAKNNYADALSELKGALEEAKFPLSYVYDESFNPDDDMLRVYAHKTASEIGDLIEDVSYASSEVNKCKQNISQCKHFIGLDMKIESLLKCKYVKAYFGRLPKDSYKKLSSYEDNPFVNFFVCTEEENYCWGVYITPLDRDNEINRIFSGLYFEQCEITGVEDTPEKYYQKLIYDLPSYESRLKIAEARLEKYKDDNREKILKYYTKLEELNLFMSIRSKAIQYRNQEFCIVGWVPTGDTQALCNELNTVESVETEVSSGRDKLKHSPPVKMKNNFLTRPFEYYTEMFGVPRYNEIDPTPFVAITYIVLFGIMFADLGHGLALSLVGLLMWKLKKMPIGKILIPCGFSSAIFGCVFGSVFGYEHLLDPMYKALFGLDEKPIEVMDPSMTNYIIFVAVGIGILLLVIAMLLGIYSCFKQKNIGEAIFGVNGVCGLVFYCALVVGIVCQLLLGIPVMTLPYVLGLIVLPLLILYVREPLIKLINGEKDWMPEKIGSFLVDSFFELFEVLLSYVTNTMSFLRVGAFVLVHAGMMQVVFVLSEMVGGIGYWIIVVIGNGIVMALEALLVAIQVLRLEFYEMFSRFYTGDGRPYEPVRLEARKG